MIKRQASWVLREKNPTNLKPPGKIGGQGGTAKMGVAIRVSVVPGRLKPFAADPERDG